MVTEPFTVENHRFLFVVFLCYVFVVSLIGYCCSCCCVLCLFFCFCFVFVCLFFVLFLVICCCCLSHSSDQFIHLKERSPTSFCSECSPHFGKVFNSFLKNVNYMYNFNRSSYFAQLFSSFFLHCFINFLLSFFSQSDKAVSCLCIWCLVLILGLYLHFTVLVLGREWQENYVYWPSVATDIHHMQLF